MELVLNVGASENNILIVTTDFSNYDSAAFKRVFTHCMTMNFVQDQRRCGLNMERWAVGARKRSLGPLRYMC